MQNLNFEGWPTDLTCEEADRRVRAMHDAERAANDRALRALQMANGDPRKAFALVMSGAVG
jgi:hypothetical protein